MSKAQVIDRAPVAPTEHTLAGRTALVTGASSGIGRAIAVELAARGASLCLIGRRPAALAEIELPLAGGARKWIYPVDLASAAQMEELADRLGADRAAPDILVHSAGIIALGALEDAGIEEFDRQLNVNVKAPYLLTRMLLGGLKQRRGQIIFINSSAGVNAVAGSGQYSATKHALRALADSLRAEVNGQVRVTSVFTGTTATPMQRALHAAKGRTYRPEALIQPEDVAAVVAHVLSLPRTVELTDIHLRPAQPPA